MIVDSNRSQRRKECRRCGGTFLLLFFRRNGWREGWPIYRSTCIRCELEHRQFNKDMLRAAGVPHIYGKDRTRVGLGAGA